MMYVYDIVIVGAGPAGLNCAYHLSKSNKKVLILEKNKTIGPKVCAGGLTLHDINYLKIPKSYLDREFNQVLFHTSLRTQTIKFNQECIATIDRKKLGDFLVKRVKNIKIKTNAKITKIEKNFVIINNKEKIRFKYLVGADGSCSVVRKHLGLKNKNKIAIQYLLPKKYDNLEVFVNPKLFKSWYAWIFPHKDYTSIGTGCDPKYFSVKKLKENLDSWLKKNKINVSKAKFEAFPLNTNYQGFKFNNIFLIGDAAGLVSGLSGEGIYAALISGEEIAKIILNKNHKPERLERILLRNKIHNKILSLLNKSGPFKIIWFELGSLLTRINYFKKQGIRGFL
ncbi:MAG: NAD(P)/FAD-dependent oxidoreductase [Candidatus Nanoarchaeia archaeon]|nr:NAD(P)/FAD-dependent oxidoreductase [Candidatus Nanoarchaeia archaeon]